MYFFFSVTLTNIGASISSFPCTKKLLDQGTYRLFRYLNCEICTFDQADMDSKLSLVLTPPIARDLHRRTCPAWLLNKGRCAALRVLGLSRVALDAS